MIDAMSFWVKEVNVDGFRCDYATGVPVDFREKARVKDNKKITAIFNLYRKPQSDSTLNLDIKKDAPQLFNN